MDEYEYISCECTVTIFKIYMQLMFVISLEIALPQIVSIGY